MAQRRPTKTELRLARLAAEDAEQGRRGILELFREKQPEQPAEDAPLARAPDDDDAAA